MYISYLLVGNEIASEICFFGYTSEQVIFRIADKEFGTIYRFRNLSEAVIQAIYEILYMTPRN